MADVCHLEERLRAAEEDSEALRVACARIDGLTADHASLTAGTEQNKAEWLLLAHLFANWRFLQRYKAES